MPHTDFSGDGGPDFRGRPDRPHWLPEGLLEVPLTVGFLGALPGLGEKAGWLFDSANAGRLRIPGVLARAGLVARARLTPEGTPAGEQCRLIAAMAARGHRTFSLTYHSPSLEPGHTPYVRDGADLARFLGSIEQVLTFFRDDAGRPLHHLEPGLRAAKPRAARPPRAAALAAGRRRTHRRRSCPRYQRGASAPSAISRAIR